MQVEGGSWKDVEVLLNEFEKIKNRQITLNGKTIKLNDINSELPEQFKMLRIAYRSDPYVIKWLLANFILNEQWVSEANVDLNDIVSINTYTADEAVKRYGLNAKDGVIAIATK
ncbi:MAG: hypothetical protein FWF09_07140 [Bacteroidales bacterium]|nr:hypothetical protein [Bacteroidales bacterium]